ncbi:MAG: hypothetical protein GX238_00325 [Epulopiscium sp.]|nr:hypothetical protein [Candidatus Epulonipiscium sp.]
MTIEEVKKILQGHLVVGSDLSYEVHSAYGSDLMSDVLAFVKNHVLLLTGLINPQVIRTAEMMDIRTIVFVRGKKPTQDVIELAQQKNMIILTTSYSLYTSCGLLYQHGLRGEEEANELALPR